MKLPVHALSLLAVVLASSSAFAFGKPKPVEPPAPPKCTSTTVTLGVNPPGSGDSEINTQITTKSSENCDPNFASVSVGFRIIPNDKDSKFVTVVSDSRFYTGDEQTKMYNVIKVAEDRGLDESVIAWAEGPGQNLVRQALALGQAGNADAAEAKFREANQAFGKVLAKHYGSSEEN